MFVAREFFVKAKAESLGFAIVSCCKIAKFGIFLGSRNLGKWCEGYMPSKLLIFLSGSFSSLFCQTLAESALGVHGRILLGQLGH